jgi:chromosome segregation ATPase
MATKEEIWVAADELMEAGQRPTLSAVRRMVGGGSYTTISEAMAEWRAKQAQPAPSKEPAPESIAAQASELAAAIWAQALALANERLQAERASLDAARAEMEQERAEAVELADTLAGELDQTRLDLEAARILLDEKDEALREEARESERWRSEATLMRENAARLEGRLMALEQVIAQIAPRPAPGAKKGNGG